MFQRTQQLWNMGQAGFLDSSGGFFLLDSQRWATAILRGQYLFRESLLWAFQYAFWFIRPWGKTKLLWIHWWAASLQLTLVSYLGKHASHLPPIPSWLTAYTTWVLLNIITGTYTNSGILLTWYMEDKTPLLLFSVTCCSHMRIKMTHEKI